MSYQQQPSVPQPRHKLRRNMSRRWIAGVCAGLADFTGLSATVVRILFLVSLLLPGPQLIFYIIAWIAVPKEQYGSF